MTYRVRMNGYGDGYEDFETLAEAEQAKREWEAEYGKGEATIEEVEAKEKCDIYGLSYLVHVETDANGDTTLVWCDE